MTATIAAVLVGPLPPQAAYAGAAKRATGAALAAPVTYHVFATREGLAGQKTANGHTIAERDHFVALPSRRGLAGMNSGDRTVRVCAPSTDRCAYAPVWDVGPWNTADDYWSAERESFTDLPRGKPEAQAAYQDGYNGGKDGSGRTVANPAGIDLADGTFWDALGLTSSSWVDATFLWTGDGPRGEVATTTDTLRLRATPANTGAIVGLAARYAQVPIECQARGDRVVGTIRTTDLWDRVASQTYVSHAYIRVPAGFQTVPC